MDTLLNVWYLRMFGSDAVGGFDENDMPIERGAHLLGLDW